MARRYNEGRIYQQPGSRFWYAQWNVEGRTSRESTKTENKTLAKEFLRKKLEAVSNGEHINDKVRVTELLADYLKAKEVEGLKSLRNYRQNEAYLVRYLGHIRASKLSTQAITQYVAARKKEQVRVNLTLKSGVEQRPLDKFPAPATINRELAFLKAALTYATTTTPAKLTRVPHFTFLSEEGAVRRQFLKDAQYEALKVEVQKVGLWFRVLFEIYYELGWRRTEPLELRVSHFDQQAGTLKVDRSKNGARTAIPITGDLLQLVTAIAEGKNETDHLIAREDGSPVGDFRKLWATVCKDAGVPWLHIHDLRRTAARNQRREGTQESVIMKVSGWRTAATFKRYDIVDNDDLIEAAKRRAEGRQQRVEQKQAVVGKPSTQLHTTVQ